MMNGYSTEQIRTAYDRHMDDLASRIGRAVDGEPVKDIALACAAVIKYCIIASAEGERADLHTRVQTFIDQSVEP